MTTTATTTATHIATDSDQSAIYGLGDSPEAAIADALSQCSDLADLVALPCTHALAALVEERGGAVAWGELRNGTACTRGQAEDEDCRLRDY